MKKFRYICLIICLLLLLSACAANQSISTAEESSQGPTWQEQYDLGVRYLSESNYQEAIIAFTAAIEIDPKQAPAYLGRGDAYVLSGETEENLAAALADYEKAIELDKTSVEAYLGLADVYIRRGDMEKALDILRRGLENSKNNQRIVDKKKEIELSNDRFVNSDEFVEYSVLPKELQDHLRLLIKAFTTDDMEFIESTLKEGFPGDGHNMPGGGSVNVMRTQALGYKIELWNHSNFNEYQNLIANRVEIRPQVGIAYGAEYSFEGYTKYVLYQGRVF